MSSWSIDSMRGGTSWRTPWMRSHSPARRLFFGSKTADLLRAAAIPTLVLR